MKGCLFRTCMKVLTLSICLPKCWVNILLKVRTARQFHVFSPGSEVETQGHWGSGCFFGNPSTFFTFWTTLILDTFSHFCAAPFVVGLPHILSYIMSLHWQSQLFFLQSLKSEPLYLVISQTLMSPSIYSPIDDGLCT